MFFYIGLYLPYLGQYINVLCASILFLFLLDEKPQKKYFISVPLISLFLPLILFLKDNIFEVTMVGGDRVIKIISFIAFVIPAIVAYKFITKKPILHIIVAFFCGYMSRQLAWFLSEITLRFSGSFFLFTTVNIILSVLVTVVLIFTLKNYQLPLFNGSTGKTIVFAIIPFLFFVFDIFTKLYPQYFHSDYQLPSQIMPTVISVYYFCFLILYSREISIEKKQIGSLTKESVIALSNAVELNDFYTSGHSRRVAEYSKEIATRLGMTSFAITEIYYAGLLHDVGKIGIDDNIINKNGKLTDIEYKVMKNHPSMGFRLLTQMSKNTEFKELASGALSHHERYDGKGYPYGTAAEEIPLIARIIAVADAYDAMTSYRSYRDPLPQNEVRTEIEKGLGTQFDANIGKIMLQMIDEDKKYKMRQFMGKEKDIEFEADNLEEIPSLEEL